MFNLSCSNIVKRSNELDADKSWNQTQGKAKNNTGLERNVAKWRESTLESEGIGDMFDMFSTASQQCNIAALGLLIFQKMTSKRS